MKRRVGIYAGTFDPVHPGHLAFAAEAKRVCQLDEVIFLPEQTPRAKQGVTDMAHRIALLERAVQDTPGLRVAKLKSPQFTVAETLPEIRSMTGDAQLTLLIGSDIATTLPYWDDLETLLQNTALAIGMRAGDSAEAVTGTLQDLERTHHIPVNYTLVHTADADMTSSLVRNGSAHQERLHPALLSYIREHGLYR